MSRTVHLPGLVETDHRLTVPLDHADPDGRTIEVFAREVAAPDGRDRPWLVFLQGGPGHEAPRPTAHPVGPGWLARALTEFRVLLLDQRGTGLSSPYGGPGAGGADDVAPLRHVRADAIVADAELFRAHLGVERWSVLGQSFGGFCALRYLSAAPDALREVLFTGGLPPVGRRLDEVYAATYAALGRLEEAFHRRYPDDADRLRRHLDACAAGEVHLPDGTEVTPRLLRTIGNQLGLGGGAEAVHHLLERDHRSPAFAHDLAGLLPFDTRNPLYAVVHESCWADGQVTDWAAARVQPEDHAGDSLRLTGEHVFPWHVEEGGPLAAYAPVAQALAAHPWPRLYDAEALAATDVPCAAAIYVDDPFVPRAFSEETADLLPGMRRWVTDEYLHNGLRLDGERILDRLLGLARGRY